MQSPHPARPRPGQREGARRAHDGLAVVWQWRLDPNPDPEAAGPAYRWVLVDVDMTEDKSGHVH